MNNPIEQLDEILETMACKDCTGYPNEEHEEAKAKLTQLLESERVKAEQSLITELLNTDCVLNDKATLSHILKLEAQLQTPKDKEN